MKNNILNRQMPVFVSSTFRDMQAERDVLMKETFPKLTAFAAQRMVTLTPIDLRWGVTEKEAKTGKVLELCLHEIERSRPFFIGLLGGRYGWCPTMEDLKANSMLLDQYDWLADDINQGLSVTEMEMQFAVFWNHEPGNAVFFIKRNETCEDEKLRKLIAKIESEGTRLEQLFDETPIPSGQGRFYYAYYDRPEDLSGMTEKAMMRILESEFPVEGDDEWTREDRAQQARVQELCDVYVPLASNETAVYYMDHMLDRCMMISSDEDCFYGKSSFLANWLNGHAHDTAHNYVYHFIGAGFMGSDLQKILRRICRKIASLYALEMPDDDGSRHDYAEVLSMILKQISGKKPLYIVLDGLQYLDDTAKGLDWMPVVPENVSVIVSCPCHDTAHDMFYRQYGGELSLGEMQGEELRLFVERYLRKYGKRFSEKQLNRVCNAYRRAKTPPKGVREILTLKSLLHELVIFGSNEQLDARIDFFCGDRLMDFYPNMFGRIESDFGLEVVRRVICLIAVSKEGLTETEILDISKVEVRQWSQVYYSILHLLILRNGKYCFDKITVVRQIALHYSSYEQQARRRLIDYFSGAAYDRSVDECLFQYWSMEQYDALYRLLLDTNVFSRLYHHAMRDLMTYWKALYNVGKSEDYRLGQFAELPLDTTAENAHTLAEIGQFAKQIMGDYDSAERLFYRSMKMYETVSHTDYEMLANVYSELFQYDMALSCIEKAFRIAGESSHGQLHFLMAEKASLLLETGKTDEAVGLFQQALDSVLEIQAETTATALGLYRNLAAACIKAGYWEEAKDGIEKTLALTERRWGPGHLFMGDAHYLHGVYHKEMGHFIEALDCFMRALSVYADWLADNHAKIAGIHEYIDQIKDAVSSLGKQYAETRLVLPGWDEGDWWEMVNFFEGIVDDLYLVEQDWEDGMREYMYDFKYRHDCRVCGGRYVFSPGCEHVYVRVDDEGRYWSAGKAFGNLRDAQLNYLLSGSVPSLPLGDA